MTDCFSAAACGFLIASKISRLFSMTFETIPPVNLHSQWDGTMRTFRTENPVDPARNYFVPREDLLKQGFQKVYDWRYFTFAPRQSGKSTWFQMLCTLIRNKRVSWLPVWLSLCRRISRHGPTSG